MNYKILVIERDDISFSFLSNQLLDLNIAPDNIIRFPSTANIGNKHISVDIVLMSYPYLDGSAIENIKDINKLFFHLPIIVISESTYRENELKCIQNGAYSYLTKNEYTTSQLGQNIAFAIEYKKSEKKEYNVQSDYKSYFENGPIPMFIVDETTLRFLGVNRAAIEKYGYSTQEFLNLSLDQIRPVEDVKAMLANFNKVTNKHYDAGYWKHKKKSGELFWVHVYTHKDTLEGRQIRISFIVDVNEKIKIETQNKELNTLIKEQKDKLDNILLSIRDGIWSRSAKTLNLIYANDAYFNLFGYNREELTGDRSLFFDSIFALDKEKVQKAMRNAISDGISEIEYRYHHKDGSLKSFQARVTYKKGQNGEDDTINGVTVDITKSRALEEKIHESEQNLLATINNTKDLIWSVNSDLKITFCNKPYQDFIYHLAEIVPKPGDFVLGEWGSKEFIENRKKDYERALGGESFVSIVEEVYDGDILYKEFSNNPIIDHAGNVTGVNCIARDVSEQKKQFIKIQEQNEKLKEIAWIQSHKVRGPVASILGLAELFVIDPVEDEHNSEILENLKTATNNLDNIIREVVEKTKMLKKTDRNS